MPRAVAGEGFAQRRPVVPSSAAAAVTLPSRSAKARARLASAWSARNRLGCQPPAAGASFGLANGQIMVDFAGRAQRRSARARRPWRSTSNASAVGRYVLGCNHHRKSNGHRGARFVTLGVVLVAGSWVGVLGGLAGCCAPPGPREGTHASRAGRRPRPPARGHATVLCRAWRPAGWSYRAGLGAPAGIRASAAAITTLAAAHRAPGRGGAGWRGVGRRGCLVR
jgi:hypothetical protein